MHVKFSNLIIQIYTTNQQRNSYKKKYKDADLPNEGAFLRMS